MSESLNRYKPPVDEPVNSATVARQDRLIDQIASGEFSHGKQQRFAVLFERDCRFRLRVFTRAELYRSLEKPEQRLNLLFAMGFLENLDVFTFLPHNDTLRLIPKVSIYRQSQRGLEEGKLKSRFFNYVEPYGGPRVDTTLLDPAVLVCDRWMSFQMEEGEVENALRQGARQGGTGRQTGQETEQQQQQQQGGPASSSTARASEEVGPRHRTGEPSASSARQAEGTEPPQPDPQSTSRQRRRRAPKINTNVLD